jgi:GT2 family glycosyltransferase
MSASGLTTMPGSVPDVSVIIVSYNTRTLLDNCLRALMASANADIETFVVDNASPDGSADMVSAGYPDVNLIRNSQNRGFAAANNLAIRRARGRYVLLLNPDTIVEPQTVGTLAAFLDSHPDVGITGPRVLNGDGSLQSCGYWYPTLGGELRMSRQVEKLAQRVLGASKTDPDSRRETDVDWVDGCCLLIRRSVIDRIGPLDEQYFLYAEELDWCRSATKAGWRIVTCPEAQMAHLRGQSSDQVKASALAMLIETRLRYYRKHDGFVAASMVAAVYALGCARRWSIEPEKSRAKLRGIKQWWQAHGGQPTHAAPTLAIPGTAARGRDAA